MGELLHSSCIHIRLRVYTSIALGKVYLNEMLRFSKLIVFALGCLVWFPTKEVVGVREKERKIACVGVFATFAYIFWYTLALRKERESRTNEKWLRGRLYKA